ncbi:atrial natriuretic peptide receptor 3 [Biomphalaria pfeifferi]|uniref:Atrial natriuretic peptide receptor 3 n=1 Tax=Biomphalaria pfeifferi TaxID=112525 RepID=A0AAD8BJJ5_BIOPF|nr:atrial natriuretic peptide receptor 3 [Biomphalaria pfeifferi]
MVYIGLKFSILFNVIFIVWFSPLDSTACNLLCGYKEAHGTETKVDMSRTYSARPGQNVCHVVVLIPFNNVSEFSCQTLTPTLKIAEESLSRRRISESFSLCFHLADTKCDEQAGPIEAFNYYRLRTVHVFLGPLCDMIIAPIARYSSSWGIPVVSPGGLSHSFHDKEKNNFHSLIRLSANYDTAAKFLMMVLGRFGYKRMALFYTMESYGIQKMYLLSSAIAEESKRQVNVTQDQNQYIHIQNVSQYLIKVMCAVEIKQFQTGYEFPLETETIRPGQPRRLDSSKYLDDIDV